MRRQDEDASLEKSGENGVTLQGSMGDFFFSFFKSYLITYLIPQDSSTNQLHFWRAKAGSSCCCLPSNTAAEECKHGCCMCSWQRGCDMCRTPSFALMGNKILKCHASSFYQPVSFQCWNCVELKLPAIKDVFSLFTVPQQKHKTHQMMNMN